MTTWKDIKLASMQKMFAAEGDEIPSDESSVDYLAAMPQACNEALELLSTSGKFIIKSVSIAHFPVANLISDDVAKKIHSVYEGDIFEVSAIGVKSYVLDVLGNGRMEIYVGARLVRTVQIETPKGFKEIKGNVTNNLNENVRFVFIADKQVAVKSIGLYGCAFNDTADIPSYKKYNRYVVKDYAPDYYQLDNNQIFYEGDAGSEYIQNPEYFQEGNKVLVLPREKEGNYTIYYKAYPEQITKYTPDDYEFPVDDEVAVLIPLYIASQLYKDDDNSLATSYRNEFEVARELLTQKTNVPVAEHFISDSGWI